MLRTLLRFVDQHPRVVSGIGLTATLALLFVVVGSVYRMSRIVRLEGVARYAPAPSPPRPPTESIRVFFGTDRAVNGFRSVSTGDRQPDGTFSSERGQALALGWCDVSVPPDHRIAAIERPSIWSLEFREDPARHLVIFSRRVFQGTEDGTAAFWASIREFNKASGDDSALVFIHGFNVGFDDGIYRTAQLAYDLEFRGAPILYSWASNGTVLRYTGDLANNEFTVVNLKRFLADVATLTQAKTVHLIAHSMGNRALTNALYQLAIEQRETPLAKFRNVILAAPDIDAGVFRQLAASVLRTADQVTLYASANDRALEASKELQIYPRAGDARNIVVISGIDTIDATRLNTDLLGLHHSYYGDHTSLLSDIFQIIKQSTRPGQRFGLKGVPQNAPRYWQFQPIANP